jgi:hypothetical protein
MLHGLAVGPHPRQFETQKSGGRSSSGDVGSGGVGTKMTATTTATTTTPYSESGGYGLGPLLGVLRGSVFSCTKRKALRAAVVKTKTKAKKAEDEYDYPEELPQV